ncbi:MAG: alpha/beta hydrolase [Gemmatimonadetes bacterium]|nr:alpha/beta hydrolase [Gemmatimonadota bacterium]
MALLWVTAGSVAGARVLPTAASGSDVPAFAGTIRTLQVNGIRMRIAQQGEGPLVLLLHGFPEFWYSWRRQLPALAAGGYLAVAPDLRGFGGSSAPQRVEDYDILDLSRDVVGLIDALGAETAVLVGHDWGAAMAWTCALLYPDRFDALVAMSVPWGPRGETPPLQRIRASAGDDFNYMLYFQEPGRADDELNRRTREVFEKLFASPTTPREAPQVRDARSSAGGFLDRLGWPTEPPTWISPEELDVFVREFERTGFWGGIQYYRNLDRSWELTPELAGRQVECPTLFLAGDREFLIAGRDQDELTEQIRAVAPRSRVRIIPGGVGHWLQQEAPEVVNRALLGFLREVPLIDNAGPRSSEDRASPNALEPSGDLR